MAEHENFYEMDIIQVDNFGQSKRSCNECIKVHIKNRIKFETLRVFFYMDQLDNDASFDRFVERNG